MKRDDLEKYPRNPVLRNDPLPVEIVFHPSWWSRHAGITFDEDFFYHPSRRVEAERRMERILYERFGDLGLGEDRDRDCPVIGAVHNAAGFLLSEMLGCRVDYKEDAPPLVVPANRADLEVDVEGAFTSVSFRRLLGLIDTLKARYSYVTGDVELVEQSVGEIRRAVIDRVIDSDNPYLTGVCCINMDDRVTDDKIRAIFEAVSEMRKRYAASD